MYIQGKILKPGDELKEAIDIRKKVFVEEYGIAYDKEFDDLDMLAIHAVAYESEDASEKGKRGNGKIAVATGRIVFDGENCKIDKIAVLKEYRNKKYGDFIVRLLLNKAFMSGIDEVNVDAFVSSEGFFKKLGFEKVSEEFSENGIKMYKMTINSKKLLKNCRKI